jgi:hypothetical protein
MENQENNNENIYCLLCKCKTDCKKECPPSQTQKGHWIQKYRCNANNHKITRFIKNPNKK